MGVEPTNLSVPDPKSTVGFGFYRRNTNRERDLLPDLLPKYSRYDCKWIRLVRIMQSHLCQQKSWHCGRVIVCDVKNEAIDFRVHRKTNASVLAENLGTIEKT